ncbi:hypothetical protein A9Q84_19415 [Halobacteriovorax marinus]|uniref:Uncharacterized protein n=1 Tax=Halobacteriovorax marinus TaxID=97084 RepID=A0A1Y5F6F6_9BACT|nr:hypothetical protein A9Q84_19415 [Halobacteriovorax marinus]
MNSNIEYCEISDIVKKIKSIDSELILIVADLNVWSEYSRALPLLNIEGKKVLFWKAPDGEKVKDFTNLASALEFFISKGIHRNAHLISIGGGATSDFAGLVASMLLRGIEWSVIPTTLLSMVDAGVGGKVAINSAHGKNLIGAFHHPSNIWICPEFLETLPAHEYLSGMGEMIKYGFLSKVISDKILAKKPLNEIIKDCVEYKKEIVSSDFKEQGLRKVLNFGHTIGHAIEKIYGLSHGVSVIWGILLVTKVFQKNKMQDHLRALSSALEITVGNSPWLNKSFLLEDVMIYIKKDKKVSSFEDIDLVLVEEIGKPIVKKFKFDELNTKLNAAADELKTISIDS